MGGGEVALLVCELKACWIWSVYSRQRSDRLWPDELVHGRVEVPDKVCIGAIVAICGMPGSASVKLHGDCAFERTVVGGLFCFVLGLRIPECASGDRCK